MKTVLFSSGVLLLGSLCVATGFNYVRRDSTTPSVTAPIPQENVLESGAPLLIQEQAHPLAPQQSAPWSHGNDDFSNVAQTLFAQGLADPRGLEYREIEVAVGEPWNGGGLPFKTHGWLLPTGSKGGQFAVAWNGLIYPVVRVGSRADLHKDFAPTHNPRTTPLYAGSFQQAFERDSVDFRSLTALKLVLLARLGETEIVNRFSKIVKPQDNSDLYLEVARDWTWFTFERAVCAHERGDDHLALADAQLLTKVQPLVEAEAKRRGFQSQTNSPNSRFPARPLVALPFLEQLPLLLADSQHRVTSSQSPTPSSHKQGMAVLITDLENVNARQEGQPGGVSVTDDVRVQALEKRGNEAVEPLIKTLESDERLTRSVSFGRDFHRERHLISVSETAYAILADLLRVQFKTYKEPGEPLSRKELATQIRVYWTKMGALSPAERFYLTLKDDTADKNQWLEAAANIVQPTDVESHGGWITVPHRKVGQKVVLRGESLRDGRTPSVSQLLAKRSDAITAIRTGSSQEQFLYMDAGQMALYLADWDQKAGITTLKKRLARVWDTKAKSNDILISSSDDIERLGRIIVLMTQARGQCGDLTAYDEYAAWMQRVEPKSIFLSDEELQKPLIEGAAHPSISHAIDSLFNTPTSPWSNVLGPMNNPDLVKFWATPLARTAGFRKQALRVLEDRTPAGTMVFDPRAQWTSHREAWIHIKKLNMQFTGSNGDPDTPAPGETRSFRVCDVFAYFYSQRQHGPKMQLFWPEKKRDAGVLACRRWLESKNR
ncbi:hypothetical protein IAD21_00272 [Abditibacteriota bacterium]|nr:hypothetical protein IAD21_00272 [Abditibacteriota bacterium]